MSSRMRGLITAASIAIVLFVLCTSGPAWAGQGQPKPPSNDDCLMCHGDKDAKRADNSPVFVDAQKFGASKHQVLACVDCHADLATLKDFPHPDKLAKVSCATCHDQPQEQYAKGIHGVARQNGKSLAATCSDCHGMHDIMGAADPASPTNHLNLPTTCAKCHGNADIIKRGNIQIGNVATLYHDSIHGKALEKSGLLVAPSCSDCHGNHEIRRKTDPESRVFRTNVPVTCGKCHAGIKQHYDQSIHGTQMAAGNAKAPVCSDCHSAHAIQRVETDQWRLAVTQECGTCHTESARTFRDTFHGQVTSLGFVRVAACADCHGSHDIQRKNDPRSRVNPANIVQTCQSCHKGANANFVKYDPHANKHDKDRNPLLYATAKFMEFLLIGVFSFFGIHTALWLPRAFKARNAARNGRQER